jgi:hypothetical protein
MGDEIWKDIPGFEGKYQASDQGRIKSLGRVDSMGRIVDETILKGILREDKYLVVGLYRDVNGLSQLHCRYIHRLIVLTFKGESPRSIDHKNRIKTDNRLSNLEIVSHRENVHRYRRNTRDLPIGVCLLKGRTGKKYQSYISYRKLSTQNNKKLQMHWLFLKRNG